MQHAPDIAFNPKLSDLLAKASPLERFQVVFAGAAVPVHPLNLADAERSAARLADIALGLTSDRDGGYWRHLGGIRVQLLECDRDHYGLVPHEELELEALKGLLA